MDNYKFIQVHGPFKANEDIVEYIKNKVSPGSRYIANVGIQANEGRQCRINGQIFEIGQRGILIFNDVRINSMSFLQDESELTLVDCIVN